MTRLSTRLGCYLASSHIETLEGQRDAWRQEAKDLREEIKRLEEANRQLHERYTKDLKQAGRLRDAKEGE